MALYQPVWVFPDQRNGLGQGTIDATNDLTVSWHVTGASALRNYEITIYENNAASTQVYTTGKINTGCPFYGTSASGEPRFFSYTIPAADLQSAGMANGNEYKLIIKQYWLENSVEKSTTQSSASVFITRKTPTLYLDGWLDPGWITSVDFYVSATYSQQQGDSLNWFRWQIAFEDDKEHPIFDTGNISGTMDISCHYDGVLEGKRYSWRCMIQTENGVEVTTDWDSAEVYYDVPETTGRLTVACAGGSDAVLVKWHGIGSSPGELSAGAKYSISEDYVLYLEEGSITWNKAGTETMDFAKPWTVIWKGSFTPSFNNQIFRINEGQSGDIAFYYSPILGAVFLTLNGQPLYSEYVEAYPDDVFTVVVTPTDIYVRRDYFGGGLAPSLTLAPSMSLAPMDNTHIVSQKFTDSLTYTQQDIISFSLYSEQYCQYFEVLSGTASQEIINAAYNSGTYYPELKPTDYMMATWENDLNVDSAFIFGYVVDGYALYRENSDGTATKLPQISTVYGQVYDYSASSQQGPYKYRLIPYRNLDLYKVPVAKATMSDYISPCWWNWTLMECEETETIGIFTVLAAYRFRLNVSTSAVSNNNNPNILQTFGRYPNLQLSPSNYKSGTLTALIGAVQTVDGEPKYIDSIDVQNAIYALSASQKPMFLKNRKGDLIRVKVSAPITMQTGDGYKAQQQTMSLPWVEVGDATNVSLCSASYVGVNSEETDAQRGYWVNTADATAQDSDIREGKTAYARGHRLQGFVKNGNEVYY